MLRPCQVKSGVMLIWRPTSEIGRGEETVHPHIHDVKGPSPILFRTRVPKRNAGRLQCLKIQKSNQFNSKIMHRISLHDSVDHPLPVHFPQLRVSRPTNVCRNVQQSFNDSKNPYFRSFHVTKSYQRENEVNHPEAIQLDDHMAIASTSLVSTNLSCCIMETPELTEIFLANDIRNSSLLEL